MTSVAEGLRKAVQLHRAGQLREAEDLYRRILKADRLHDEALNLLGVLCHQTGRHEEAVTLLKQAVERRKRDAKYHSHLGLALEGAGRLAEAEQAHRRAVSLAPDDTTSLNNLGVVLMNTGRPAEAQAVFERALSKDPAYPDAHCNFALSRQRQGDLVAALPAYERAVQLSPANHQFLNNYGTALQEAGQLDRAAEILQRALRLAPNSPEAHNNLGLVRRLQGRTDEALSELAAALALRPGFPDALHNRAHTLHAAGRHDEAVEAYRAVLASNPRHLRSNLDLAALLRARGDAEGAARRYWTVLQDHPNHPDARMGLIAHLPLLRDLSEWEPATIGRLVESMLAGDEAGGAQLFPVAHAVLRQRSTFADLGAVVTTAELHALAADTLLLALLPRALGADPGFEGRVSAIRAALMGAIGTPDGPAFVPLACAVAAHVWLGEHVHAESLEEITAVAALEAQLAAQAAQGPEALDDLEVALVAAYRPLAEQPWGEALAARAEAGALSAPLTELLRRTVQSGLRERALAESIPQRTPISDEVSLRVQAQYEANPYPRWTRVSSQGAREWNEGFATRFPWLAKLSLTRVERVLVAGCGTGQQPIRLALVHRQPRIVALDLSRRSLAYAARMAEIHGVADRIEFGQADLLALGGPEAQAMGGFDRIYCTGVLHHLADPAAGLAALTARLNPGGIIHLGLYSRAARRRLNVVRAFAAERGFAPDRAGLQALRAAVLAEVTRPEFAETLQWRDFYAASDCRDLLLHVQETQYDLAEVGALLAGAGLEFLALEFDDPRIEARFREEARAAGRDPEAALRSLEAWADFEARNPDTFRHMYQLYARAAA